MNTVSIDSRGCGHGKTRSGIIPLIKDLITDGYKALVVVPSIALQRQYLIDLELLTPTIINSETRSEESVAHDINYALGRNDDIIIITHQAFLNTPIFPAHKIGRALIIDEVFDPFQLETVNMTDSAGRTYFDFSRVWSWRDSNTYNITHRPNEKNQPWYELHIVHPGSYPSLLQSPQWRRLSNTNNKVWATWQSGYNFMNNTGETVQLVTEVNPEIIMGYELVHIAAAAFDRTFMSFWLKKNSLYPTIHTPFIKHSAPLVIHAPQFMDIMWSKNLKKLQPDILPRFIRYIDRHKTGPILYVQNNDDLHRISGTRINHNAHGVNQYSNFFNYAHLSALQPNKMLSDYYKTQVGMTQNEIRFAFGGYVTYQLLMRTALRNPASTQEVNVFLLDCGVALALTELFDNNHKILPNIPIMDTRRMNSIIRKLSEMNATELLEYKDIIKEYNIKVISKDAYIDQLVQEVKTKYNSKSPLPSDDDIKEIVVRVMGWRGRTHNQIVRKSIEILSVKALKKPPMTNAERARAFRERKRNPPLSGQNHS